MPRFLAFAFLALIGLAHAEDKPEQWTFLIPGEYHANEAPVDPGKGWLALTIVDGLWHLIATELSAEPMRDVIVDAAGQMTGIRISSKHPGALALFREPRLSARKIDTPNMRFKDKPLNISPTQALDISFKGQLYQIVVVRSEVLLTSGSIRTKLRDISVSAEQNSPLTESASLLWAGDLDRDGLPDLLISYSGDNRSGTCLFLSAKAPKGTLVDKVACHAGVGC